MADRLDVLILDLLEWLAAERKTYAETMDAWRTSCPGLPVWEDADDRGFVTRGDAAVSLTSRGRAFLQKHRGASTGHAAPH